MLDKCLLVPSGHTSLFRGHVSVKHMYLVISHCLKCQMVLPVIVLWELPQPLC